VSPYLEKALCLEEHERVAWLSSLKEENPELANRLQAILDDQRVLAQEGFLERSPMATLGESLVGRRIGAYTLMSCIGQGGMGTVWLAERSDGRFDRRVAVKFLRVSLATTTGAERFRREGRILGQLAHPHIAELIDAGVTPNAEPYLVLEHIDGQDIDQYCDDHNLDLNARIRLFLDVLSAVVHAHAHLIVHRDIKPSNVRVGSDGEVKLLDFGIAKLLAPDPSPAEDMLTREGGAALTPEFAAPEQLIGRAVTTATDVYALGVLLYLLLTGQHPAGPAPHSPADLIKMMTDVGPPRASDALTSNEVKTSV